MELNAFKSILEKGNLDGLIAILLKEIDDDPKNLVPRFQIAKAYIKITDYPKAVNTYIALLQIDPDNEEAKFEKEAAQSILAQSQLDVYACTNTHMDPWA